MCDFVQINTPNYKVVTLRIVGNNIALDRNTLIDIELVCDILGIKQRIVDISDDGTLFNRQQGDNSLKRNVSNIPTMPFARRYLVIADASKELDYYAICSKLSGFLGVNSESSISNIDVKSESDSSSSSSSTSDSSVSDSSSSESLSSSKSIESSSSESPSSSSSESPSSSSSSPVTPVAPMLLEINLATLEYPDDTFGMVFPDGYTYNCEVDWGDGSPVEVFTTTGTKLHTYGLDVYTLSIKELVPGGFPTVQFRGLDGGNFVNWSTAINKLKQWGGNTWVSMASTFHSCVNMLNTATDHATAQTQAVTDFSEAFNDCYSLESFPLINTSSGMNFSSAWRGCLGLTSFPLINTGSGVDFSNAWRDCLGLTSFPLINTSNGTNFSGTWYECNSLAGKRFPLLNLRKITNGVDIFGYVPFNDQDYSAILDNLAAANPPVVTGVTFDAFYLCHNEYSSAYDFLVNSRGWTINDSGTC